MSKLSTASAVCEGAGTWGELISPPFFPSRYTPLKYTRTLLGACNSSGEGTSSSRASGSSRLGYTVPASLKASYSKYGRALSWMIMGEIAESIRQRARRITSSVAAARRTSAFACSSRRTFTLTHAIAARTTHRQTRNNSHVYHGRFICRLRDFGVSP